MNAPLARLGRINAAHVTGILVVGLIAGDLLSGTGPHGPAMPSGAVQNYVLFTTVNENPVTVTTGTQFVSTTDRRIVSQWPVNRRVHGACGRDHGGRELRPSFSGG